MKQKPTIYSPCINVCTISPDTGHCLGCFRSREEISDWLKFSDEQKLAVIEALDARRAADQPW
ncbi:MAG: DUF1289 domain-containing protein [Gammaproteobacteria bacterium]|jgi:predicted Fe-S protein YdhL (DUF1289 family)|nr:DUF1289 domain-containing protein [Gammaproteobacteria bacterium]